MYIQTFLQIQQEHEIQLACKEVNRTKEKTIVSFIDINLTLILFNLTLIILYD